jgi:hypothetical protein
MNTAVGDPYRLMTEIWKPQLSLHDYWTPVEWARSQIYVPKSAGSRPYTRPVAFTVPGMIEIGNPTEFLTQS